MRSSDGRWLNVTAAGRILPDARRRGAARSPDALFVTAPHLAAEHAHQIAPDQYIDTPVHRYPGRSIPMPRARRSEDGSPSRPAARAADLARTCGLWRRSPSPRALKRSPLSFWLAPSLPATFWPPPFWSQSFLRAPFSVLPFSFPFSRGQLLHVRQ